MQQNTQVLATKRPLFGLSCISMQPNCNFLALTIHPIYYEKNPSREWNIWERVDSWLQIMALLTRKNVCFYLQIICVRWTFSLSQMNNVELARTLSWRELEIANTELWAKWKGKTHFSRNEKNIHERNNQQRHNTNHELGTRIQRRAWPIGRPL